MNVTEKKEIWKQEQEDINALFDKAKENGQTLLILITSPIEGDYNFADMTGRTKKLEMLLDNLIRESKDFRNVVLCSLANYFCNEKK